MNFADAALVSLVALKLLAAFSFNQMARHCLVDLHVDMKLYCAHCVNLPSTENQSFRLHAGCWFFRWPV